MKQHISPPAPVGGATPLSTKRPVRDDIAFWTTLAYLWVVLLLFGAVILETVLIYPNVFADPPASLAMTMQFLEVRGPSDVFPPFGFLTWMLGGASLLLAWHLRPARWWFLFSLAMIVGEGVASVLYFWPRNEIMFVEGLAVHSPEVLIQAAREFETWHWRSRMGFNAGCAVAACVGFLKVCRLRWSGHSSASAGKLRENLDDRVETAGRNSHPT